MTDSEALTEARVRRILAEIDETAPANDGPGAVSAFYTSLSFTEVRALCALALSALGTAPAVGVKGLDQDALELAAFDLKIALMAAASGPMETPYSKLAELCIRAYLDAAPATAAEIRAEASKAYRQFKLWFFRDVPEDVRLKLFGLMMYGIASRELETHASQAAALDFCVRALSEGSGNGE